MSKVKSSSHGGGFFPKGGSAKMAAQQGAHPARSGQVSTSAAGKGAKFAEGGKTKMFGKQSASPRVSGRTGK
jgi:hypothetical protein